MRRRYEDVSKLVQYQLKTNQQGNIEVYVDDRFVGNVSGPGNDRVEFEGEGRLIVETEASHYEIEVS